MNPRLLICDHESQEYAEVMLVVGDKYFPLGTTHNAQGYSKEYAMEGMTVRQEIPLTREESDVTKQVRRGPGGRPLCEVCGTEEGVHGGCRCGYLRASLSSRKTESINFGHGNMTFRWNEDRTALTPEKFTMTDGTVYKMERERTPPSPSS